MNFGYVNGIEGVVAGGTAVANVLMQRRVHEFHIFATATAETDATNVIDWVRIFVNSTVIVDLTSDEIQQIMQLNGLSTATDCLSYYLSEPWRASIIGEESTSWDLYGQVSCQIQMGINSGVTAPVVQILHGFDFARNITLDAAGKEQTFLSIVKRTAITLTAGVGTNDITQLPTQWPISRIYIEPSTGNVNSVEVYKDDEKIFEATRAQNTQILQAKLMDASQFNFPICFDHNQQVSSAIVARNSLLVKAVNSAAGTNRIITERRANGYV